MIQVVLVGRTGQTLGKKIWGIVIVDKDSLQNAGFIRNTFTRGFINAFGITLIVPLIDILWIFKKERRCLHDLIAGTVVINRRIVKSTT